MKKLLLLLFLFLSIGINAQPPSTMPEFTLCDGNGDGFETFNLDSQVPVILNGLNPNTTVVTFHQTSSDAQVGINAIASTFSYINTVPNIQIIYIRVVDNTNSEVYFSSMALVVSSNNAGLDGSTTICDSSNIPINLSSLITGEQSGGTWTRAAGAGGTFNAATGTFTSAVGATTSTFVYSVSGSQSCPFDTSVATIIINSCAVPIVCGNTFTDPAGASNYANNSNYSVTIYPTNPGDMVTVTFTAFSTESNFDALYVFNGNSTSAPQISSGNTAGSVPGGLAGGYWGNVIPGPFTSTSPDGSLTFSFRSDGSGTAPGWSANVTCGPPPSCRVPISLSTSAITSNSVTLNWTQPTNTDNTTANTWQVIALPCGSPAPTAGATGWVSVTTAAPYTLTELNPLTCYSICIRAVCSPNDLSVWTCFNTITTLAAPPICGGQFIDNGGATANYSNAMDSTTTICPQNTGERVTVTFATFDTEATWDALYVFDGNTIASPQIVSTNAAGNVPGGLAGGFWGTTIPGPFTSSDVSGCLTFRFRSDNTQNRPGWIANITCAPAPTCSVPNALSVTSVTATTATINWFQPANPDTTIASEWEYLINIAGSPVPTPTTSASGTSSTNSFISTNLTSNTCYTVYVRAICSSTETSGWSFGYNFCTQIAPPVCGGQFIDNGGPSADYTNNADVTTTICPTTPGEIVSVIFNTFDVEATWDALYVFDGNSIASPQIVSTNAAGNVPGGLAGGFWGTTIPGPFVSTSADGCLTFRFRSDNTQTRPGWTTNVICAPDSDKIVLVAFVDENGNGIKDSNELLFPHGSFVYQQNNDGVNVNGYSPTGQFALYDANPANTYSFSYELQSQFAPYYNSGITTYSNISVVVGGGPQFLYFPIILTETYNDVAISIAPITAPRPAFPYVNRITYRNQGITAANGTLTFAKPAQIATFTTSQAGVVNNVSGFTYNYTNLQPNEIRSFTVSMNVPLIPTVNINDLLTTTASITAPANDIDLTNNTSSNSQIVVNSWDPNDKMESRGKTIPFNTFTEDDYFFYTIRFQNNGTANAIDVRIEDILNPLKIDAESVRMVSASHNYTMKRIDNQLVWDFKNILLTPSTVNENNSRGYVQFKVKLIPGFQAGDIIPNNASIYFDSNPAIVTATFNSKFTVPLAVETFDSNSLTLYPNPATNAVQIDLINTNEQISKVVFYDILGKTVKSISTVAAESLTVDVSELSKGLYLVEMTSENNIKLTKKLVIQ